MTNKDKIMFFDAMLASTDKQSILRLVKNTKRNRENAKKFICNLFQCRKSNIVIKYRKGKRSKKYYYTNDVIKKGAKAFDLYVRNFDVSNSIRCKYNFLFSNHFENRYREKNEKIKTIKEDLDLASRVIYQRSKEISYYI
tara:strand:- start:105 stop:524 length:420 start_codon:yes stop_codon:yes gene_type:complete